MRRKQATVLIDEIRCIVADYATGHSKGGADECMARIADRLSTAGLKPLEPCGGEAHSNAFIDNFMRCAPRWGWVGTVEKVS